MYIFLQTIEDYHLNVDDKMDLLLTIAMERGLKTNFNDLLDYMEHDEIEIDHKVSNSLHTVFYMQPPCLAQLAVWHVFSDYLLYYAWYNQLTHGGESF